MKSICEYLTNIAMPLIAIVIIVIVIHFLMIRILFELYSKTLFKKSITL